MPEKKELVLEELEKVCGGADTTFTGLTVDEMAELNKLLNECLDYVQTKNRDKFQGMIVKVRDFRDAHPNAYEYVNQIVEVLKEVWRKVDIWF